MARYGKKAQDKVEKAMHERKHGTLKSGSSGKKVTSRETSNRDRALRSSARGRQSPEPKKSSSGKRTTAKRSTTRKSTSKKRSTAKSRKAS